ncbi:MAG TPA: 4Fe-4S binding protein [Thermotogota bacterium]|nr:4Fe-4S binding protein [Thermotogota bacterium]HRW92308.1 4Fe-4S binding protein [Thermotogota bacterium]
MKTPNRKALRHFTRILGILLVFGGAFGLANTFFVFPGLSCYAFPYSVSICPMGILQNFLSTGTALLLPLAFVMGLGLVLGRGWCGWFCPFGTFQDILGVKTRPGKGKSLWWIKFVVLALTLFLAWLASDTLFCKVCPAGTLEGTLPYLFNGTATLNPASILHLVTLGFVVVMVFFYSRFWCRYLCPVGAIFGIFNRVTPLQVRFHSDKCLHCNRCSRYCPQGLDVVKEVNGTDCIKCGECIVCDALSLEYRPVSRKEGIKRRLASSKKRNITK